MASTRVSRGKSAPKARAGKRIGNAGVQQENRYSDAELREAMARAQAESRAEIAREAAAYEALRSRSVTITLGEACDLVGRDLDPSQFQRDVFNVIARELDTLTDLGVNDESGFEGWAAFQNLRSRILLAGKISAMLGGAQ